MNIVLDASAVLAYLHDEPGADRVRESLDGARLSSVNWSEVAQKIRANDGDPDTALADLRTLGVIIEPFTDTQAGFAALIWKPTKPFGLSLGDRACLSLAMDRETPVLTADRKWSEAPLDLDVRQIR